MTLDTRIPLMVKEPAKLRSPLEQAMAGMKYKDALQQQDRSMRLNDALMMNAPNDEKIKNLMDQGFIGEAKSLSDVNSGIEDNKISSAIKKMELGARILSGARTQQSYDEAVMLGKAHGFDTSSFPKTFDPLWVDQRVNLGISELEKLKSQNNMFKAEEMLNYKNDRLALDERRFLRQNDLSEDRSQLARDQLDFQKEKINRKEAAPLSVGDRISLQKLKVQKFESDKVVKGMELEQKDMDRKIDNLMQLSNTREFKQQFSNVPLLERALKSSDPVARSVLGQIETIQSKIQGMGKEIAATSGAVGNPTAGEWEQFGNSIANVKKMTAQDAIRELPLIKQRYRDLVQITKDANEQAWSQFDFSQLENKGMSQQPLESTKNSQPVYISEDF